jgi:hypothetical protein
LTTARAQIRRLLDGAFVDPEDLADDAYVLVAAHLPDGLRSLDVVTQRGVAHAGLPANYPVDDRGNEVGHGECQGIAIGAHDAALDGVEARSAATPDGRGREFAWWPEQEPAVQVGDRINYGRWRSPRMADAALLFG